MKKSTVWAPVRMEGGGMSYIENMPQADVDGIVEFAHVLPVGETIKMYRDMKLENCHEVRPAKSSI